MSANQAHNQVLTYHLAASSAMWPTPSVFID